MASAIASRAGGARRRNPRSAGLAGIAGLAVLLGSAAPARADSADKATAEALFAHAKSLMKEGRFGEACPKFAESQRLDAGIGTMLYLADCYERNGQTASAWAIFLDAAGVAHAAGQADREKKARERAAVLEGKLNRMSISLATGAEVEGIEVKRDGQPIGKALWGTAVPLDPGEHSVEASAPGREPWSVKVQLSAADTGTRFVVVPTLFAAPKPEPVKPPVVEPPKPEPPRAEAPRPEPRKPRAAPPRALPPEDPPASSARVAGYSMLGIGLATAAVGGILGAVALLDKSDATSGCRADNVCLPDAAAARGRAQTMATASTGTHIAGGSEFVIGVVILIAAKPAPSIDRQVSRVIPRIGVGPGGVSLEGAF